jgi:hypothetical protein
VALLLLLLFAVLQPIHNGSAFIFIPGSSPPSSTIAWTFITPLESTTTIPQQSRCGGNTKLSLLLSNNNSNNNNNNNINDTDIEYLKNQAEQLRNEIAQFEEEKRRNNALYEQQQNDILKEQQQLQERYSVMVPILKPDGTTVVERCTFTPVYKDGTTYITTIESDLPLGIIIGETMTGTTNEIDNDGTSTSTSTTTTDNNKVYITIDEVSPNSNGAIHGLRPGDIIHACTACKVDMELPTWQLLLGGIGRPKTNRYMYSVGQPNNNDGTLVIRRQSSLLEQTMNAIASNRLDPEQRPILLVIERRD